MNNSYDHTGQSHLKVKVIPNQIASVWISIPKRAVGLQLNAFLLHILTTGKSIVQYNLTLNCEQ